MQISTLFRGCALAAVALVSAATFAQKSVTTTKTGELSSLIPGADRYKTKNLTVAGPLNGEDLKLVREMCGRDYEGYESEGVTATLDLSKALIKQEAGKNYFNEKVGFYSRYYAPSADNEIGVRMFYRCEPLKKVILPENTTIISGYAFQASGLTELVIPNTVKTIRQYAFASTNLKEVILPASLLELENKVFDNCANLTTVVFTGTTPPNNIPAELFNNCPKLSKIIVPNEALDAYTAVLQGKKPEAATVTGLKTASLSNGVKEVARFDLEGRRLSAPTQGINVVRYSDGTTAKVLVP